MNDQEQRQDPLRKAAPISPVAPGRTADGNACATWARRNRRGALGAAAAVVLLAVALSISLQMLRGDETRTPAVATSETDSAVIPQGAAPKLGYIDDSRLVVPGHPAVPVSADAVPLSATNADGGLTTLVYEPAMATVAFLRSDGALEAMSDSAISRPVFDQSATRAVWVTTTDQGVSVVLAQIEPSGTKIQDVQPIAEADPCCTYAAGIDQFGRVFVSDEKTTWVWDSDEGREGAESEPADSSTHLWRVPGVEGGQPIGVTANELLLRTANPAPEGEYTFSWGTVPRQGQPYVENGRLTAVEVWFSRAGTLLALDAEGRIHHYELDVSTEPDTSGESWVRSTLTGPSTAWDLPEEFRATGLVDEIRGSVLVDGSFDNGTRAWLRYPKTGSYELATTLSSKARTPRTGGTSRSGARP